MRKMLMLALLLLALGTAALAEAPPVDVVFGQTEDVGHFGQTMLITVKRANNHGGRPGKMPYELRNHRGQVLCGEVWHDASSPLTFEFRAEAWMLGGHELSVWHGGEKVSENGCYMAISDVQDQRITQLPPSVPAIAPTIVCGGGTSKQVTEMLALLNKHGVKVTFFLGGEYLAANEEDCRRIVAAGHEIGSHGLQHTDMTQLTSLRDIRHNITAMNSDCELLLGVRPRLFRAPFSYSDERITAICRAEGMEDVQWNIDSCDWSDIYEGKPWKIRKRVMHKNVPSGSVIQFHLNGYHTVEVLDQALAYWQKVRGFRIVTVTELMELSGRELPPLP